MGSRSDRARPGPARPSVPQAKRGLARVHADAEELELEDGFYSRPGGGQVTLHAETRSAGRLKKILPSLPELVRKRRQLGGPRHVKPVGIDLPEVVAHVQHVRSRRYPCAALLFCFLRISGWSVAVTFSPRSSNGDLRFWTAAGRICCCGFLRRSMLTGRGLVQRCIHHLRDRRLRLFQNGDAGLQFLRQLFQLLDLFLLAVLARSGFGPGVASQAGSRPE